MTAALTAIARNVGILMALIAVMYGGLCLFLFAAQRSMIYQPQRGTVAGSNENRMILAVAGADLHISTRPLPGSKALLYFGGNAENVSLSLAEFAQAFPDRAIFLMHYRGYEGSSGKPSEAAIQRDALTLFDQVHAQYADVAVVGRSLGSGVAVRLASVRPVSGLVLITPYSSIEDIAAGRFPYVPVRWLLLDKFESWRYASAVHAPTLLLAAGNDELIPLPSTQKLYRAFPSGVAALKVIPFFGHNDISSSPVYMETIRAAVEHY